MTDTETFDLAEFKAHLPGPCQLEIAAYDGFNVFEVSTDVAQTDLVPSQLRATVIAWRTTASSTSSRAATRSSARR